jgi:hypothetical protein
MSRVVEILEAIRNGQTYEGEPLSRVEAILKSISDGSGYTDIPKSRHEELLLAIKNGGAVDLAPRTRIEEILVAVANGTLDEYLSGKNLFDIYNTSNRTQSGVVAVTKNDAIFIETTESQFGASPRRCALRISCKKNTNYNVSLSVKLGNTLNNQTSVMIRTGANSGDALHTMLLQETTDIQKVDFSFNSGEYDELYVWLYLAMTGTEGYQSATYSDIKVEVGTAATLYTPYAFKSDLEEAYYLTADKLKEV